MPSSQCRVRRDALLPGVLASLLMLTLHPGASHGDDEDVMAKAAQIYAQHLEKYQADTAQELKAWPQEYMAKIEAFRESVKKKGDLDGVTATDAEIERFQEAQDIGDGDVVATPAALAEIQRKFQGVQRSIIRDKNRNILNLTEQYAKRLTQIEVELTKQERIEDALAVRAEKNRLLKGPVLSAAKLELAVIDAETGGAEPVEHEPDDPVEEPLGEPGVKREPRVVEAYDPEKFRILDGAVRSAIPDVRFKKLTPKGTRNLRVGRKLIADASLGVKQESEKTSFEANRAELKREIEVSAYMLRVILRPTSRDSVVEDATIVVQLFSKPLAGHGSMRTFLYDWTRILRIDATQITVETPSAEIAQVEDKFRGRYAGRVEKERGDEYYGAVITVFDAQGSLIYQAATQSSLDDRAVTELPRGDRGRIRAEASTGDFRAPMNEFRDEGRRRD